VTFNKSNILAPSVLNTTFFNQGGQFNTSALLQVRQRQSALPCIPSVGLVLSYLLLLLLLLPVVLMLLLACDQCCSKWGTYNS
jgi:hypothetical protein